MIEVEVKGKREICFLVKKGEANDIVIPLRSLAAIDYQRLVKMEEEGGELMKTMRETVLDNGTNALVQFQHLLVTVNKEPKPEAKVEDTKPEGKTEESDKDSDVEPEVKPRGRGRHAKNKP